MLDFESDGLRLAAAVTIPQGASPKSGFPGVVLAQGLSGVKNVILPEVAQAFAQSGIATLAFDYRGCGESEGDPQRLFPLERIADIRNAAACLRTSDGVDPGRVGVYGVSYGAGLAAYATAIDETVKCVAAIAGVVDGADFLRGLRTLDDWITFKDRLEQDRVDRGNGKPSAVVPVTDVLPFPPRFYERYRANFAANSSPAKPVAQITLQSAQAMADFCLSSSVHHLHGRPAFVVHGTRDDVIAIEDVRRIVALMPEDTQFVQMDGCDHIDLDGGPAHQRATGLACEFFKNNL